MQYSDCGKCSDPLELPDHALITFMVSFLAALIDKTLVEMRDTVTVE